MSRFAAFALVFVASSVTSMRAEAQSPTQFLKEFCIDCHRGDDPGGDRDLASLDLKTADQETLILTQDVIDQLTLGAMPPDDAEAQPTSGQRGQAIKQLTETLATLRARSKSTGGQTVLRRLTRAEYRSTVSDLLGLDLSMFDPTIRFPRDETVEHLDNVGDALVTSAFLLEQYFDAADAVIEKTLRRREQPEEREWTFNGDFHQQPELSAAHRDAFDYRYMCLYDCPLADKPEGAYGPLEEMHEGVHADGIYRIRVLAQSLHRDTPYTAAELRINLDEKFRLGIRPGDVRVGSMHNVQPIQPLLGEAVIEDGEPQWYEFQVPLDRGLSPRFTFENGMEGMRPLHNRLFKRYRETLPKKVQGYKGIFNCRRAMLHHGKVPQIRIHEITIRGPIFEQWPSDRIRSVLPDGDFREEDARSLVARFASRAYRRPTHPAELDRLMAVYQRRLEQGQESFGAFKDTLKVVLCSPSFLYLQPDCPDGSEQLSPHALANRLSYFLTGSMPDEELRQLTDEGKLKGDALVEQARRLLRSEDSDTFVGRFLDAWLNLRELGAMPPDRADFWPFYADGLQAEMKRESELFLRHLIDENLPVSEWLSADYSFLNRDLARLYGCESLVPADGAERFRRVTFADKRRGGLLGQASVLTVSANGIETSPVVRGVWMLENVLGTPPAPPPDDVPAIDPDVRGAKSIRDLLKKHRQSEACNECHRKIDPLGFALESFDPIGRLRSKYRDRVAIDTSGKLPGGDAFDDVVGLKKILIEQRMFFVRSFARKLFEYALGRRAEASDRPTIDGILDACGGEDALTQDVIEQLVSSAAFRRR
ncbi:MAG: DUF1592 domain-containing protein [Planctomycetota bacterium]